MICTSLGGLPHLMLHVYDCIYTEVLKSVDWEFVLTHTVLAALDLMFQVPSVLEG